MTRWKIPDRSADLHIVVDAISPSKKNRQQIRRRGARRFVTSSDEAKAFEARLRALAQRVRGFGKNYVAVRITTEEESERTLVEVWDLGPQPPKGRRNTRRDIHNTADAVMDALQGIAFDDDRQARIVVTTYGDDR